MQATAVEDDKEKIYDIYREALAVQERKGVPAVDAAVDRRAFDATLAVFNDQSIQALICMCCARICLQTAGPRSSIEYKDGMWFLRLPVGRSSVPHNGIAEGRHGQEKGWPLGTDSFLAMLPLGGLGKRVAERE